MTRRPRSWLRWAVTVTLFSMACERHIGAPERESARHKEPEFIIHIWPWGPGASRAKKGEKKSGVMGGWCCWLHGGGLVDHLGPRSCTCHRQVKVLPSRSSGSRSRSSSASLLACQCLQFFGSASYPTPATLATHAHAGGASLNLSLSPHDSWTSSRMDRWWTAGCLGSSGQVHGAATAIRSCSHLPSAPDAGHYSSFCLDSVMIKKKKKWDWNDVEMHNFSFERHAVLLIETRYMWGDRSLTQNRGH